MKITVKIVSWIARRAPRRGSLINKRGRMIAREATLMDAARATNISKKINCLRFFQDSERTNRAAITETIADRASVVK